MVACFCGDYNVNDYKGCVTNALNSSLLLLRPLSTTPWDFQIWNLPIFRPFWASFPPLFRPWKSLEIFNMLVTPHPPLSPLSSRRLLKGFLKKANDDDDNWLQQSNAGLLRALKKIESLPKDHFYKHNFSNQSSCSKMIVTTTTMMTMMVTMLHCPSVFSSSSKHRISYISKKKSFWNVKIRRWGGSHP